MLPKTPDLDDITVKQERPCNTEMSLRNNKLHASLLLVMVSKNVTLALGNQYKTHCTFTRNFFKTAVHVILTCAKHMMCLACRA